MANDGRIEPRALSVPVAEPLTYPDSDGHFSPDNPLQANAVMELRNSLREHFHGVPNVVVEGDMFLYYAKGEADERRVRGKRVGKYVAPDLIVVLDHDLGDRQTYKLWEEGKPPDFALEVISPSSAVRNRVDKRKIYARIGIGEYFVFQPNPERAGPQLVGYALEGLGYRALRPDSGSVRSEALGVSLRPEGSFLRVRDLGSGKEYRWHTELVTQADEDAAARRRAEETAAREAEARHREAEARRREAEARRRAEETAARESEARRREAEARCQADETAAREAEARRRAEETAVREAEARKAAEARIAALEAKLARRGQ